MRSRKELIERGIYWLERMRADEFPIAFDVVIEVDHTQKCCFAYCHKKRMSDQYEVHLTPALAEVDDDIVDNTIIHELIHTCPSCWCHTGMFRAHGARATRLYELKYPIDTKGDKFQSQEIKKSRAYFEKSKLLLVNLVSGEVMQSFKSSGTWMHRFAARVLKATPVTPHSDKWMLVKDCGKVLLTPMFAPSVTEENKKKFNEKFASLGLACYPKLPIMQTLTVHPRKPSVSATAKVKPQMEARIAAKAVSKPVVVYAGTTQLSLF